MDWVEKKAERLRVLAENSPRIWNHLCNALDHAVKSYNRHFISLTGQAQFGSTPYSSAYVQRSADLRNISFDPESCTIGITRNGNKVATLFIRIEDESGNAVLSNGKDTLTIEEASQLILEPVLDFKKPRPSVA
jgi:hypothetical protein